MKKIIAFVLLICLCVPAMFACSKIEARSNAKDIVEKYSVSQPTKVFATTKQTVNSVVLDSTYEIITGYVDNAPAFVYKASTEQIRSVEDGGENEEVKDLIKITDVVIEGIEGKGTRTNGGEWKEDGVQWSIGRGRMALNLDGKLLKDVVYEGNTFTCTVPFENVAAVFGTTYSADMASDVLLVIKDDGAVITSIELWYNLKADAEANITTSSMYVKVDYTYDIERITIE